MVSTNHSSPSNAGPYVSNDSLKTAAFQVLENNCNECHQDKKPNYLFTLDNMDFFAASINNQVFVKAKMPKGRKNKLSPKDKETLQKWVNRALK